MNVIASPDRLNQHNIMFSHNRLNTLVSNYEDDPYAPTVAESQDNLSILKSRLNYFFLDPIEKWRRKNIRPWKLLIQVLKIFVFTTQLIVFGTDMSKFITYKDEMLITFKQLLLKDWDPSADALAYPGPYVPYAIYTRPDLFNSMNYAIRMYSNITDQALAPLGYQTNLENTVSPITFCSTDYVEASFDPAKFRYNYSLHSVVECNVIENFAPPGSEQWLKFDIRNHTKKPINFSTLISANINLPLRTLLLEDPTQGDATMICFNMDINILYDNRNRDGQIVMSLSAVPRKAQCEGKLFETDEGLVIRKLLSMTVFFFCMASFSLCTRSTYRANKLVRVSQQILAAEGRTLTLGDRLEFLDPWLVLIIFNDILVALATIIISFSDDNLFETDNYTICSLLIGMGNFLSWTGLLRYLSFFKKYNILILTLRKSFAHVMRFMICTLLIYCGFCFCGWIVFGPYHFKFRQLSTTTECLFSLINGDDMFETFALLRSEIGSIWWFSRIYLYLFVSLFIYVVLSLFIALIMDAYEMIKEYSDTGFPRTRLQSFYLDGDISKLALAG